MTPRDVAKKIQTTLTLHDIAPRYRVAWLKSAEARFRHLNFSKAFKSAIQKIQRQSKQPRYPIFFDVKPLVQWAFGPLGPADRGVRLDRLLLQLRLTTLMRSVDVANITWGIFCQGSDFFIQTTTKTGALATFSVAGMTLQTLLEYVWLHLDFPAPYLIRYVHEPHKCMGSERIAKRVKERMQELGIPTEAFKAHSLRGATATTLLMHGMEPQWVQARGGWTNQTTMQVYYSRLHQVQDWERALQGKIDASNLCVRSVVPVTKLPLTEADEGRRRGGSEEQGTTLLTQLTAHGVLRPLYLQEQCPSCGQPITREAAYKCQECEQLRHVRCHPLSGTGHPSPLCFLCQEEREERNLQAKSLIIDVMGVCNP